MTNPDGSPPKPGVYKTLTVLLLPRTFLGRLAFFGVVLGLAYDAAVFDDAILPATLISVPGGIVDIWFLVVAVKELRRRRVHLALRRALVMAGKVITGMFAAVIVSSFGPLALSFIASSGSSSWLEFSSPLGLDIFTVGGITLMLATSWLLVRVPQRLFSIKLGVDRKEEERPLLLGLLITVSLVLTGTYIFLLHFGGGPLSGLRLGPLAAGIIAAVLLVAPAYRSLAKACWRHGISGVFSLRVLKQRWGKTLRELDDAFKRDAARDMAGIK